jgi:hypothetical protein
MLQTEMIYRRGDGAKFSDGEDLIDVGIKLPDDGAFLDILTSKQSNAMHFRGG